MRDTDVLVDSGKSVLWDGFGVPDDSDVGSQIESSVFLTFGLFVPIWYIGDRFRIVRAIASRWRMVSFARILGCSTVVQPSVQRPLDYPGRSAPHSRWWTSMWLLTKVQAVLLCGLGVVLVDVFTFD